jgi:hypothetical protein
MTNNPDTEDLFENSVGGPEAAPPTPDCLTATLVDFDAVDLDQPMLASSALDCSEIGGLYRKAANDAKAAGRMSDYRAYSMIEALCTFHLKPDDPNEPFGPLVVFGDRRSMVPDDFRGSPEQVLLLKATSPKSPAVRARINDTLWLLDKSRASCGQQAIEGYLDTINAARDAKGHFRSNREGADFLCCNDLLRRALHIARTLGWDSDVSTKARTLANDMRKDSYDRKSLSDFMWATELDLDLGVSEPATIAIEGENLLPLSSKGHQEHRLLHMIARAHGYAGAKDERNRCLSAAAECLVTIANAGAASAMYQAHWLERAIQELYRVPGSKDRRK